MSSQMVHIRQGNYGRVAILEMARPLTEHAHSERHLQFWLAGDRTHLNVGDTIVPLDKENAIAINSWEPHAVTEEIPQKRCTCLLFYLNDEWIEDQCAKLGLLPEFDFPSIPVSKSLRSFVRKFAEQLTRDNNDSEIERQCAEIFEAVILAMKDVGSEDAHFARRGFQTDFRIRKSVEFMRNNFDVRLSFDQVARESGLSRPHFFYLFRKHMKMTPSVFWNTIRMEVAIDKLIKSQTSMTELSYSLGFTEPGNFSRFFRCHSGVCPSQYRLVAGGGTEASDFAGI